MPHHTKVRKLGFYRMMRRNFDEGRRIRVLDNIAFNFIIPRSSLARVRNVA